MAQIPSLIISIAAGIVVSRVASDQDIGTQLAGQLFAKPQVLYITAGIIGGMGLIPGMPNLVFLLLAGCLAGIAYMINKKRRAAALDEAPAAAAAAAAAGAPAPPPSRKKRAGRTSCRSTRSGWKWATA